MMNRIWAVCDSLVDVGALFLYKQERSPMIDRVDEPRPLGVTGADIG